MSEELPSDLNVRLLVIATRPHELRSAAQFLNKRGWQTTILSDVKEAVTFVAKSKPDWVLLSVNLGPSAEKISTLLAQTFNVESLVFAEYMDPGAQARLSQTRCQVLHGRLSGPSIQMKIRRILKDRKELEAIRQNEANSPSGPIISGTKPGSSGSGFAYAGSLGKSAESGDSTGTQSGAPQRFSGGGSFLGGGMSGGGTVVQGQSQGSPSGYGFGGGGSSGPVGSGFGSNAGGEPWSAASQLAHSSENQNAQGGMLGSYQASPPAGDIVGSGHQGSQPHSSGTMGGGPLGANWEGGAWQGPNNTNMWQNTQPGGAQASSAEVPSYQPSTPRDSMTSGSGSAVQPDLVAKSPLADKASQLSAFVSEALLSLGPFHRSPDFTEMKLAEVLAVMALNGEGMSGYLVVGSSLEQSAALKLSEELRSNLLKSFAATGLFKEEVFGTISVRIAGFLDWAKTFGEFYCRHSLGHGEIVVSYHSEKNSLPKLQFHSSDPNKMIIAAEDIPDGSKVPIPFYLHLPENNRFVRILRPDRWILPQQKDRLKTKKVQLVIDKEDAQKFELFYIKNRVSSF